MRPHDAGSTLVPQRQALVNTETVLFIHDDEAKLGIDDIVLKQRVGTDDEARSAFGDCGEDRLTLPGGRSA